ncbi:MAG: V-type ATP synthase subunit A [Candidatus Bipolaricaulia bacterium]
MTDQDQVQGQSNGGRIVKVAGPLVVAEGLAGVKMYDVVRVGEERLVGEVIELDRALASIQVYEETAGLGPGDPVMSTDAPLSVELGPGLIESIYDGVQRPLELIEAHSGTFFIHRGAEVPALDRERRWAFTPAVEPGEGVGPGDVIGTVQETSLVEHHIMVPPGASGTVEAIESGDFTVTETVCILKDGDDQRELTLMQRWPVRRARPYQEKLPTHKPLVTGQRVIDALFPVSKGGTACVPGPFGSGKTVIQHQLSSWADADIILFVGCGERGNEMTDVLMEFPELVDPRSGDPLMRRTVLIANTSNMPVAAREASVYTGITIAEYFRDMGYDVALMADSTSRWAEAMREISGRLEEMPGEEGYPAYLGSRIADFYARAGRVVCLGKPERQASLSAIGAVSPPGGDLSEPVTQNTLRLVKVFWGLDDQLANRRHFPAINWLTSYSQYTDQLDPYLTAEVGQAWGGLRDECRRLLQVEAELEEIVRLVGIEALSAEDRLTLEVARSIREDFLMQNAFDEVDTYTSLDKQLRMMQIIIRFHRLGEAALERNVPIERIIELPVRERIARAKFIPEDKLKQFEEIESALETAFEALS